MNSHSIIDVNDFFARITGEYSKFGEMANLLAHQMSSLDSEQILAKCTQLGEERRRLAGLDEQLIEIIELAGEDFNGSPLLIEYRRAFSFACRAVDTIHEQLLVIRQYYQDNIGH